MPRRKVIDEEKETERAIKTGSLDHVYREMILRVDDMAKDFALVKSVRSERAGLRLAVKMSMLEIFLKQYRHVLWALRKHNIIAKRLEAKDND